MLLLATCGSVWAVVGWRNGHTLPGVSLGMTWEMVGEAEPVWSNYPDELAEFYDGCSSCQTTTGLGC